MDERVDLVNVADTRAGGPQLAQERRLVTAIPGPRSTELFARRNEVVARGVSTTLPIFVSAAGGGVVVDVDGNSLIDFGSGIAVVSVGNAAPRVVDAVTTQVAAFTHTCFMVTPYEGYVAVCEKLNQLTPGDHPKKSALFNSGAEAVENAVKIARAFTGRPAVVVFDHAYHGRTNLTMALTAKNMPYKQSFGPFAPEVYRLPMAYPFRWPTGPDNCGPEAAAQAISAMRSQIGADNIAAVVIEPIQGEGGFIVPGKGFLPALAEFCTANGIVFVADEIQTGFARTGAMFASFQGFVSPESFSLMESIAILAMVVLGGIGHIPGVVLGGAILAALPEVLRHVVEPMQQQLFGTVLIEAEVLRQLLYGLAMVVIMLYRPAGIWPSPMHEDRMDANATKRHDEKEPTALAA